MSNGRLLLGAGLVSLGLALPACHEDEMSPMDMGPLPDPYLRVANFVAGAPAFDVCVRGPNDANYIGPIVRTKANRIGGVPYSHAGAYVTLPPGSYLMRAVSGAGADCNTPFIPQDIDIGTIAGGRRYTLAVMGNLMLGTGTFQFPLIEDDNAPAPGQVRLRFIHAATSEGNIELGSGTGAGYMGRIAASGYGTVGDLGNDQTYLTTAPVNAESFSLRNFGGSSDIAAFPNKVTLAADAVYTVTAIGDRRQAFTPIELSLCNDTTEAVNGLSNCQELR